MSGWWATWRLALRLGWRDAWRNRARSAIALTMLVLPIVAVTAADVLLRTATVDSGEALRREMGDVAAARVIAGADPVELATNGADDAYAYADGDGRASHATAADLTAVLGKRETTPLDSGTVTVATAAGRSYALGMAVDGRAPLAHGLLWLTAGRWPQRADEVTVNGYLAAGGRGPGTRLTLFVGRRKVVRTIVGVAESGLRRESAVVTGLPGALPWNGSPATGWLVGGAPVTLTQVMALSDRLNVGALSRMVMLHPPPELRQADSGEFAGIQAAFAAVAGLIAVMMLLQVVLLAGPAFAVGARKQSRSLALMAASGSTPGQSRRVVLGYAVVVGVVAAVVGVVAGVTVAWLAEPALQRHSSEWLGPFDVRPRELGLIAAAGVVSALLAALVPAWIVARQDVVAVLAGRRGEGRPSSRLPVVGVALLGIGVAMAVLGVGDTGLDGAYLIALSTLPTTLGIVLVAPLAVVLVARLGARLPLPLRFAVRDAARHRTRTVPAVAAVAATVGGVIAFGIGVTSDDAANRAHYEPALPVGQATIESSGALDVAAVRAAVATYAPHATLTPAEVASASPRTSVSLVLRAPAGSPISLDWGSRPDSAPFDVGDDPGLTTALPPDQIAQARGVLARGGVVIYAGQGVRGDRATITVRTRRPGHQVETSGPVTVPALYLAGSGAFRGVGMLSTELARRLGLVTKTGSLQITGGIPSAAETRLAQALNALPHRPTLYVERGYQRPGSVWVIEMVLLILGAVLMVGGTLTATHLALDDARPDLATLGAVGASTRTRRLVAAAYAFTIAMIGALLGCVIGFVPGIAVTYPLTAGGWSGPSSAGHVVDVPWALVGLLVVALPLGVAGLVAVGTRSRLPMVARLS